MGVWGQSLSRGTRVKKIVEQRTLPHFHRNDDTPEARGFIFNNYVTGLNGHEFFFHTGSGREGLIDTAIKTAIGNAKKTGIGLVAVKNSGHYGLSGYYAEQAVKKGLMVMVFTNAPPAVAPHGALKSLFGTNPICFGTPTGSKVPFILDTSISMINRGKIRVAAREGTKIPEGVALDKFGKPTTDPKKALEGVQLPIAGFRGSGLAWMVDILSGVLTGGNHAGRVKDPFTDFSGPQNIGHLFFVLKPNLFVGNSFNKRIKDNIKTIKKLPKIKGIKEILYPGQSKFNRFKSNLKKEIQISKVILKDLEYLQGI
jgi:LDH2 family malate/lactate/ureidoglycolate dehydrogenase